MMVPFAVPGLLLITAAWITQFISMNKKNSAVKPVFVMLYAGGVLFLVIDGLSGGLTLLSGLNLVSLIGALLVLGRLKKII